MWSRCMATCINYVYLSKSLWTFSESSQSEPNCLSKLLITWLAHDRWSHCCLHIVRLMIIWLITWLRLLFEAYNHSWLIQYMYVYLLSRSGWCRSTWVPWSSWKNWCSWGTGLCSIQVTMHIGRNDVIWNGFLNIRLRDSFVANWNTSEN